MQTTAEPVALAPEEPLVAAPPDAPAEGHRRRRSSRRSGRTPGMTLESIDGLIRFTVAVLVVAYLASLSATVNLARYWAQEQDEPENALRFRSLHPQALDRLARRAVAEQWPDAAARVDLALAANPVNAELYARRAYLALAAGDREAARADLARAQRLAPFERPLQQTLTPLYQALGDTDALLDHLGRGLALGFANPQLSALADDPRTAARVEALAARGLPGWSGFLEYRVRQGRTADAAEPLIRATRAAGFPVPEAVTRLRIERLQREGQWQRAYLAWLEELSPRERAEAGFVFNGNFRLPLSNLDFDWRHAPINGVTVGRGEPDGLGAGWALFVNFPDGRHRFRHLYQTLVLRPGQYRLGAEARTVALDSAHGLRWELRCRGGALLGQTEAVVETRGWIRTGVAFEVPAEGCPVQELRLVLGGELRTDFDIRGTYWARDVSIRRLSGLEIQERGRDAQNTEG
jgi:tetratricopeptide (TPR) repeat protein